MTSDPPTTASPVVLAQGLRFTYPGADGFTLEIDRVRVDPAQHTACIGPSGCGKSTLLRLLIGVLRPTAGAVTLDGARISHLEERRRRILRATRVGMVFQSFALLDYLSALDNILLPYRVSPALRLDRGARDRARALASDLGIARLLDRRPGQLSQGECQRVAICRALVTQPRLVACDEPTGNLDPQRSRDTIALLRRQADATGATLFVVTHNHELLASFQQVLDLSRQEAPL